MKIAKIDYLTRITDWKPEISIKEGIERIIKYYETR